MGNAMSVFQAQGEKGAGNQSQNILDAGTDLNISKVIDNPHNKSHELPAAQSNNFSNIIHPDINKCISDQGGRKIMYEQL